MILKKAYLFSLLLVFSIFSCSNSSNKKTTQLKPIIDGIVHNQPIDSIELFFQSKGVLRLNSTDINLKKDLRILNDDNTIYATFNLSLNKIIINSKQFSLEEFANDESLRYKYSFFPKEFFPQQSVIQFEYINLKSGVAEIFIDKAKNIKKRIRISGDMFKAESWKEHLLGSMIDFNVKNNPIRFTKSNSSKSIGYENSEQDYVFVINEISGDWIKIECAEICDYPCSSGKKYDGWIKWKSGDKLLIRLLYSC
jgi:hypothetical protein